MNTKSSKDSKESSKSSPDDFSHISRGKTYGKTSLSILFIFLATVFISFIVDNSSDSETNYKNQISNNNQIILKAPLSSERVYQDKETISNGIITASISVFDDVEIGKCGNPPSHIRTYTVKEGDTISQIADAFCVSEETIAWQNDIHRTGSISVGRELVILPVSGILHKIKDGETLSDIAQKHDVAKELLGSFNDIPISASLREGDFVIIPDGERKGFALYNDSNSYRTSFAWGVNGPNRDEFFINPISGFSVSQHLHGHNAIDIAAPTGTSIKASGSGRVIISRNSGWNGGYGKYIVIEHKKGLQSLYAHNSRNTVSVGDEVSRGDIIGYTGSSGYSISSHGGNGSHLHFEVHGAKNILRKCALGVRCN